VHYVGIFKGLYYDARSEKHQIIWQILLLNGHEGEILRTFKVTSDKFMAHSTVFIHMIH